MTALTVVEGLINAAVTTLGNAGQEVASAALSATATLTRAAVPSEVILANAHAADG